MSLEQVMHTKNLDSSINAFRTIIALLPSPKDDKINIEQIRVVLVTEEKDIGNHWREYKESYGIIGKGVFTLKDIDSGEQKDYLMETGDILDIPARIALKVNAKIGSVITCISESYDREKGTHKYFEFN